MQKILLVEDDPLIYRLYQKVFALEGFEVQLAENGQSALDQLKTFHPDIILLDIMMRAMNGLEVLDKLGADPTTATIPVLVLTNISDTRITQRATEKGAAAVMIKSESEPDAVIAMVRSILAKPAGQ
ncbi:MAG TPA: response regulator [Candidatus Saccharimonadia bacterium]|nr:response regulator [Candidatus Saccharimonadia bacterium]